MDAVTTVGSLTLEPPLVNGSGVIDVVSSDAAWNLPEVTVSRLGAFVTKSLTSAPRTGHPQPWAEVFGPGTLVNAAGLPNPGVERAILDWAALPARLGIPVIVSIGGDPGSLAALAERVDAAGWAAGIELNLSCPNVAGALTAGDPVAVERLVSRVRSRTSLPLFAKLSPAVGAPRAVAAAAVAGGADALTCGNTMPVRALGDDGTPLLGGGADGGLSGAALHAINLRLVSESRREVEVPIVGLGGVDGIAAAERMRSAGADIVGVGTGAVYDPSLVAVLAHHLGTSAPERST